MNVRSEIAAIVAGTVILAAGVALELAGKVAPPELWVAGTAALTGGVALATPSSPSSALAGELSKLAGYLASTAPPTTAAPQSAPEATAQGDGPAAVTPLGSPLATADPAPATSPATFVRVPGPP